MRMIEDGKPFAKKNTKRYHHNQHNKPKAKRYFSYSKEQGEVMWLVGEWWRKWALYTGKNNCRNSRKRRGNYSNPWNTHSGSLLLSMVRQQYNKKLYLLLSLLSSHLNNMNIWCFQTIDRRLPSIRRLHQTVMIPWIPQRPTILVIVSTTTTPRTTTKTKTKTKTRRWRRW